VKFTWKKNLLAGVIAVLAAVTASNGFGGEFWATTIAGGIAAVQGILQLVAHFRNPNGGSVKLPYNPPVTTYQNR